MRIANACADAGALLTTGALTYATVAMRQGNRQRFQYALRWRVAFQTVTVGAIAASLYMYGRNDSKKTVDGKPVAWNNDKVERREHEDKLEWRKRFSSAQDREERENDAIRRMVMAEVKARARLAASRPAPAPAPEPEPEPKGPPRIGQDKRGFTFSS